MIPHRDENWLSGIFVVVGGHYIHMLANNLFVDLRVELATENCLEAIVANLVVRIGA